MPRLLDELKPLIDAGRESLAQILDPLDDDGRCAWCGDIGFEHLVCPGCGRWDWRDEQDRIDDAMMAEALEE